MRPDFAAWSAPDGGRPVELSVLIPAYNEESCLGALVRETACVLHGTGKSFEILVVDDGSSDWTPRLLNDLRAEIAELRAVRLANNSGHWILCRRDPALAAQGKNPLQLDSKAPSVDLKSYIYNETRYKMLVKSNPEAAAKLLELAQAEVQRDWAKYAKLADLAPAAPAAPKA